MKRGNLEFVLSDPKMGNPPPAAHARVGDGRKESSMNGLLVAVLLAASAAASPASVQQMKADDLPACWNREQFVLKKNFM